MSISAFQNNLTQFLDDPESTDSSDKFASFLTKEYDTLIKSGFQVFAGVSVLSANPSGMESTLKTVLTATLNSTTSPTPIIQDIGKGVLTYWSGALLIAGPPPAPPAPGSLSNVSSTANPVLNVGTWASGPQSPQPITTPFVSQLVATITSHLATVSGIYNTVSLYPAAPSPVPAPGVLPWVGYTVP